MSLPIALTVAYLHGHLVTRPGSDVFHVYTGPLTPSGRWVPRAGRTVRGHNTRRLSVMARVGAVVDLGGRRICAGCVDQLTSLSPTQPVARDDRKVFWAHVTLGDLAVATALATSEDDTHAIGTVATLVHGPMGVWSERRLTLSSPTAQARHALEAELVRRRDQLRVTDEDREAARRAREEEADDRAMSRAARRKSIARERALERHRNGGYLTPWERDLVNTA